MKVLLIKKSVNVSQDIQDCATKLRISLREKCPISELIWSALPRIETEYVEILRISPYSDRMRESTDQNNTEYGHFLRKFYKISQ